MRGRRWAGLAGSVAVHAVLLVWAMGAEPPVGPETAQTPDLVPIEIVQWVPSQSLPVAKEAQKSGEFAQDKPAVLAPEQESSVVDPLPTPPKRTPRPRRRAQSVPADSPTASDPVVVPAASTVPDAPEGLGEPGDPLGSSIGSGSGTAPSRSGAGRVASARRGAGRGRGHGRGTGDGLLDYSAYGAELVRIVMAEIDGNPVLGISKGESIKIVLRVLPDGRLARTGEGRWDFARVVESTISQFRTRRILRRVERASYRFPRHPDGFPRRTYEMDFTVNFTGSRAG